MSLGGAINLAEDRSAKNSRPALFAPVKLRRCEARLKENQGVGALSTASPHGHQVKKIVANNRAFAAVKRLILDSLALTLYRGDGTVVSWGCHYHGVLTACFNRLGLNTITIVLDYIIIYYIYLSHGICKIHAFLQLKKDRFLFSPLSLLSVARWPQGAMPEPVRDISLEPSRDTCWSNGTGQAGVFMALEGQGASSHETTGTKPLAARQRQHLLHKRCLCSCKLLSRFCKDINTT